MKNVFILICFLVMSGSTYGQVSLKKSKPQYGVKITIGKIIAPDEKTFVGNPFDYINHEVEYVGASAVKNIGLFYQHKFGWLYLRSELGYSQFTQRYDVKSYIQVANPQEFAEDVFHNVDFQVMAGITHKNFRFGVGPIAHVKAGSNTDDLESIVSGYQTKKRSMTYGFTSGIGYDIGRMHFDLRYELGFRNVGDHLYYVNRMARSETKANVLSFTFGVSF